MKRRVLLIIVLISTLIKNGNAQDSLVNLDLLKAPTSPGFILLNKQPSDIERPTSPTDFAVNVCNASQGFAAFPGNYAVQMAPYWLFGGKSIKFADAYGPESNKKVGNNILQTMSISTAVSSSQSTDEFPGTQLGFGLKFSIVRGKPNAEFQKAIDSVKMALHQNNNEWQAMVEVAKARNKEYQRLLEGVQHPSDQTEAQAKRMEEILNLIDDSVSKVIGNKYEARTKKLSQTPLHRVGYFLDFATGTVIDFPTQTFENAQSGKTGAWLTGGYEGAHHVSALVLARWLYERNMSYTNAADTVSVHDNSALDFGARIAFDRNHFTASGEALLRTNLVTTDVKSGWRGTVYVGYDIGQNKVLSFQITRDFDNAVTGEGSLITALNLILGFGSARNVVK